VGVETVSAKVPTKPPKPWKRVARGITSKLIDPTMPYTFPMDIWAMYCESMGECKLDWTLNGTMIFHTNIFSSIVHPFTKLFLYCYKISIHIQKPFEYGHFIIHKSAPKKKNYHVLCFLMDILSCRYP